MSLLKTFCRRKKREVIRTARALRFNSMEHMFMYAHNIISLEEKLLRYIEIVGSVVFSMTDSFFTRQSYTRVFFGESAAMNINNETFLASKVFRVVCERL